MLYRQYFQSMTNLETYEIDRKLNSVDTQSQLYEALATLSSLFPTLTLSESYFIPRLIKIFSETPFMFIKYKISAIFVQHAAKNQLFANAKEQIVSTLSHVVSCHEGVGLELSLKMVGQMGELFAESLTMYHLLLAKLTSTETGEEIKGYALECLSSILSESQYLSGIFIKNYDNILKRGESNALVLLSKCLVARPLLTRILIFTLQHHEQQNTYTKISKELWRIVWREIPVNSHLSEFLLCWIKGVSKPKKLHQQLVIQIMIHHPFLGEQKVGQPSQRYMLDILFEAKKHNQPIEIDIEPTIKGIIQSNESLSTISTDNLLLLYYSKISYDSDLSKKSVQGVSPTHLKIILTLGYYHTARNIIEYLLGENHSSKEYKRFLFYLKIVTAPLNNFESFDSLDSWSKYNGEGTIQHQYTFLLISVWKTLKSIEQKKREVSEDVKILYRYVKQMEERWGKVSFAGEIERLRVLEMIGLNIIHSQPIQASEIRSSLGPFVPTHFLCGPEQVSLPQLTFSLLYFPKPIYIHKR